MLENEAEIFEATPRAPLAAVAMADIAASWMDAASPVVGATAMSDGIGCVPARAGAGGAAADESLARWEPFWRGYAGCTSAGLGAPVPLAPPPGLGSSASLGATGATGATGSETFTVASLAAGSSASAASSAAPRSAVMPGEPSPAARDDSTRLSTRPPQHGSLTRGYPPASSL